MKNIKKNVLNVNKSELPNFRKSISTYEIKNGYLKLGIKEKFNYFFSFLLLFILIIKLFTLSSPKKMINVMDFFYKEYNFTLFMITILIALFLIILIFMKKKPDIYLMNFALFKGNESMSISKLEFIKIIEKMCSKKNIEFQKRISEKSDIGDKTLLPPFLIRNEMITNKDRNMEAARKEAETVIFTCVNDALLKTNLTANQIGILIVNCSLFCPTPSLSSMIVNHFKMSSKIKSFNLGGMGCSAGVISIDLAKDLLLLHKNTYALVVSTENITQNLYLGNDKSMILPNTLFRVGGVAVILSNHKKNKNKSLMRLKHVIRIHKGNDDKCYKSVYQTEDDENNIGVRLSRDIMEVAGIALKSNITVLGPLILPWSEQIKYFLNLTTRMLLKNSLPDFVPILIQNFLYSLSNYLLVLNPEQKKGKDKIVYFMRKLLSKILQWNKDGTIGGPYIPDFTTALDHFCIHAGGKRVLDAIEMNLKLPKEKMAASRYTLYRYGNTSSSSIWYEMDYHLHNSNIKKNEKIWQLAFGSGFKCNSAIWEVTN